MFRERRQTEDHSSYDPIHGGSTEQLTHRDENVLKLIVMIVVYFYENA